MFMLTKASLIMCSAIGNKQYTHNRVQFQNAWTNLGSSISTRCKHCVTVAFINMTSDDFTCPSCRIYSITQSHGLFPLCIAFRTYVSQVASTPYIAYSMYHLTHTIAVAISHSTAFSPSVLILALRHQVNIIERWILNSPKETGQI